jgi:CheY-like chemotaxis protein
MRRSTHFQKAANPMTERTHKVLVADDDEAVRESLCKLLYAEGYQVVSVANGAEAVKAFHREQDPIDLLLLDLNMPLKNGWATLDRLIEVNPSLPVLIVTGQPNQYELAQAAGVSALVEKPIDVPALLQLIKELLPRPVESRRQRAGHRECPFRHLRAAGYASRYLWTEQKVTSHSHWGLNE